MSDKFPPRNDVSAVTFAAPGEDRVDVHARLEAAMEEVLEAIDAGETCDRDALLAKYRDVREELVDCLRNLDFIQNVAPQLAEDALADPSMNRSSISPQASLGDFRILRELGRGGMGVVYEAEQLSLGRRIALKVLPFAAMLDKQQLARFKNEARAAATLDHPNIVAIYSVGSERSVHYYAMQLVEGRSLAQMITELRRVRGMEVAMHNADGPVTATFAPNARGTPRHPEPAASPTAETRRDLQGAVSTLPAFDSGEYYRAVARLGIQAAEALDHAHQNGILHRDIKPANLLLDDTGKLWVTDFGLARIEADAGMTMTGDLLGTLRYMSPEQALAKRLVVDHRSDIYSLGVTLYELLTLRPAYTGDDRQNLLRQIAFEEPRRPRQINDRIPQDLETIVLKAIERIPADRYATAHALADDLHCYLAHMPIAVNPATHLQRARKWIRRHPTVLWSAAAAVMVATVISIAGSLLLAAAYSTESSARLSAELERAKAELERRRAERAIGRMQFESGMSLINQGSELGLLHLLDASIMSTDAPDQREAVRRFWAIGHDLRAHTLAHVFSGFSAGPAYSPDGSLLASVTENNAFVELWSTSNGEAYGKPLPSGTGTDWVEFSPTGVHLATHSTSSGTRLWNAHSGTPIGPFLRHGESDNEAYEAYGRGVFSSTTAFSPDGKLLATVGFDGRAQLWEAQTGKPSGEPLQFSADALVTVAFSPNGKLLAVGSADGTARLWDIASRQLHGSSFATPRDHNGTYDSPQGVRFSPDGKLLAVWAATNTAWLLDTQTGEKKVTLDSVSDQIASAWFQDLVFSPDGKLIVTASADWTAQLWNAATGNKHGEPLRHDGRVTAITISPNGQLLASGSVDRTLRLWNTETGAPYGHPLQHSGKVGRVTFSPDGKFIAASQDDTRVWEINYQTALKQKPPCTSLIGSTVVSLNGHYRATINEKLEVELLDTTTGQIVKNRFHHGGICSIAFNPESNLLATGSIGWTAKIWDVATGREVQSFFCDERVYGVAFNPAGNLLAAGLYDGNVSLWNIATGQPQGLRMKHSAPVWEVAFSPDGSLLATAFGRDKSQSEIKLWDITTDPPYQGLRLPFKVPRRSGTFDSFSLTGKLRIGETEDKGHVEWQLPKLPQDVNEMRLRTWVASGFRHDLRGAPIVIPAKAWRGLRDERLP